MLSVLTYDVVMLRLWRQIGVTELKHKKKPRS